jgi:hypothetical protein
MSLAFALKAKAPEYLGFAKNIIDTAGHFIIGKGLRGDRFHSYTSRVSSLFVV